MQFRGPVSAVCLIGDMLLAASGPYLTLYRTNMQSHTLLWTSQVFPSSLKIIALTKQSDSIVVRAERTFKAFKLDE
jgi:hypothetical protein